MSSGNIVAVVSIIATALASGFGIYVQYINNEVQQERIIELEKFKVSSELERLETKAKIERFNLHCSKIEEAIKHTSSLLAISNVQSIDLAKSNFAAHTYMYLLPKESQLRARESYKSDEDWVSTMYAVLIIEYRKCVQINY